MNTTHVGPHISVGRASDDAIVVNVYSLNQGVRQEHSALSINDATASWLRDQLKVLLPRSPQEKMLQRLLKTLRSLSADQVEKLASSCILDPTQLSTLLDLTLEATRTEESSP